MEASDTPMGAEEDGNGLGVGVGKGGPCTHTDDERAFTATYTTPEIQRALVPIHSFLLSPSFSLSSYRCFLPFKCVLCQASVFKV